MTITARTATSANTGSGTASTIPSSGSLYPTDAVAGDLVIMLANSQTASGILVTANGPAANSKIDTQQGTSNNARLDAWQAICTSTDLTGTANFTLTSGGTPAPRNFAGCVAAFGGCTYESITDGTQTAGVTVTAPTVTPSKDSSTLVLLVTANGGSGGTGFTLLPPSGWTQLANTETTTGGSTVRGAAAIFIKALSTGTAGVPQTGPTVTTSEGATNRYMTATAVLAPSAATLVGAAAMASSTALAGAAPLTAAATAAMSSTSSTTGAASLTAQTGGGMSSATHLAGSATAGGGVAAAMSSTSALTGAATQTQAGSAAMASTTATAGAATLSLPDTGTLASSTSLTGAATVVFSYTTAMASATALTGAGTRITQVPAAMASSTSLAGSLVVPSAPLVYRLIGGVWVAHTVALFNGTAWVPVTLGLR